MIFKLLVDCFLCVMEGLVGEDGVAIGTPLSFIKNSINMDKVSQVNFANFVGDVEANKMHFKKHLISAFSESASSSCKSD